MVFHDAGFLFVFLPVAVALFAFASRYGGSRETTAVLICASVLFYGLWSIDLLVLLLASVTLNFCCGRWIGAAAQSRQRKLAALILGAGIMSNLAFLGYFKYANFFVYNINILTGSTLSYLNLVLPIGISFYTFVQIGYLIDVKNGQAQQPTFAQYILFASFFPYVTAGPIVLQHEILPQIQQATLRYDAERITSGFVLFSIGLFKKLVIADNTASFADSAFHSVSQVGSAISAVDAWLGVLAYTLQLYFDFSGYSDMALALGLMFGIKLPLNFNSPLKATSIIEFWRRWHMTMTRFFTNYVYTPIALSMTRRTMRAESREWVRFALATAYPMILTFAIAGLWHGAGWTFVVFGFIHGVALTINHSWRRAHPFELPVPIYWVLTFLVFVVSLVFFRSPTLGSAWVMIEAMFGYGGGMPFDAVSMRALPWLTLLLLVVLLAPNSQQLMSRVEVSCDAVTENVGRRLSWMLWRPTRMRAIAAALLFAGAIALSDAESPFIYYQF